MCRDQITFRVGGGPPEPCRQPLSPAREARQTLGICVRYGATLVGGVAALVMLADLLTR